MPLSFMLSGLYQLNKMNDYLRGNKIAPQKNWSANLPAGAPHLYQLNKMNDRLRGNKIAAQKN